MNLTKITTSDIHFASALQCLGAKIISLTSDPEMQTRALMTFEIEGDLKKIENDFYSKQIRVEPNEFGSNIRTLKNMIKNTL